MNTLHIINSAKTLSELKALQRYFDEQDAVIFIQDGCYNLNFDLSGENRKIYAIAQDMQARGIENSNITPLDYPGFVELTLNTSNSISW